MYAGTICKLVLMHRFSLATPAFSHSIKTRKREVSLIGHSKLTLSVNLSVDACLSLYVSPVM